MLKFYLPICHISPKYYETKRVLSLCPYKKVIDRLCTESCIQFLINRLVIVSGGVEVMG